MDYRRDIDGLRAIAVVPVVLYHAGFAAFGGGFVGVDIFFVISGFLITSLIAPEILQGDFSILRFYERRIRRIFPALFVVMFVCAVAATILFMPQHLKDFSQSLGAATLFLSNVLFWTEAGYFDAPAEFKPLLHTWSLAVEEQFYIVFPPALWALLTFARRSSKAIIIFAAIASFGYSLWSVKTAPDAAFYLPFTRMWELLLGSMLALGYLPPLRNTRAAGWLCGLGFILIAMAVFGYSHATPFPGAAALLPCLGAALVIYARAPVGSLTAGLLHWAPVVNTGLLSYSLYLWHWPLYVFLKYYQLGEVSIADRIGVVLVSFLLAVLSLRFIEAPFRRRQALASRGSLFATAAICMMVAVIFGAVGHLTHGWPARLSDETKRLAAYSTSVNPYGSRCHATVKNPIEPSSACQFGSPGKPSLAVWGDSHASMFVPALAEHFGRRGERVIHLSFSGCPPAPDFTRADLGQNDRCAKFNDDVLRYLSESSSIRKVLLIARWTTHLTPTTQSTITDPAQRLKAYSGALRATVVRLRKAGKEVVIFYPVPEVFMDTPSILARMSVLGRDPSSLTTSLEAYRERHDWARNLFAELADMPGVTALHPEQVLCDMQKCRVFDGKDVLYHDHNHLTQEGARRVVEALSP